MQRRNIVQLLGAAPLGLALSVAHGQKKFPDRPIRVVTPYATGNTIEIAMREIGHVFQAETGQPLVVESKPGASGTIAAIAIKLAKPDGYNLLVTGNSMWTINPHTFKNLQYDPDKDFEPITLLLGASQAMAIRDDIPAKTLDEFITWARERPGQVQYASFGAGNTSHFIGAILNNRAHLDMLHVPYNGTPPAVTALLSKTVDVAFVPMIAVKEHVEAGKVRVLAITAPKRSNHMPDVPTFAELGYPDLEILIWAGLVAPKGTPKGVIDALNTEVTHILRNRQIKEAWYPRDFTPMPMTPEEFRKFYQAESKRWAEAVRLTGFTPTN